MCLFSKVLVANRGEIAARVIRGANALGCATVAVYSEADAHALHVCEADEAVCIGGAAAAESYLSIEALLEAARATGAEAIHPGYGFLAENADFSRAVSHARLTFVGPTPEAIDLMGAKRASKLRMIAAGVPCTPGYQGEDQSDATLVAEAKKIGCPVMVKASAGGGGRGMRRVDDEARLEEAIKGARSEAKSAFGSGELILEKAVTGARHVEIQVLADNHGHVIHIGERDCSIQRRNQKIVEEAPSPAVDEALRARMGAAAVEAAAAIDYRGAGTVEFLLDAGGAFYFMEMNTRLQVEHPVTETVTGLDLVAWQLRIAAGERLALTQDDIAFNGHAIEVRLCLEDVTADFMPQTGRIEAWRAPAGPGIRVDHGLTEGQTITPHYDSMAGKIIAWGETREIARRRLISALGDTLLFGPISNRDFLIRVLSTPVFAGGDFDIGFIDTHMSDQLAPVEPPARHRALAAAALYADSADTLAENAGLDASLVAWRSAYDNEAPLVLEHGENRETLRVGSLDRDRFNVSIDGSSHEIVLGPRHGSRRDYSVDGVRARCDVLCRDRAVWLCAEGFTAVYGDVLRRAVSAADAAGDGRLHARMDGKIARVDVAEGDTVAAGDTLLVLEAMKMEFSIAADIDGAVAKLLCAAGDQVAARQLLLEIEPAAS